MAASYEVAHCEHSHQEHQSHRDHDQADSHGQCKNHCPIPHILFNQLDRSFNTVSTLIRYEKIEFISLDLTATFLAQVDRPPIG